MSHHHELARRRTQMGQSMIPMVASEGPPSFGEIGDGYWIGLSGAPSPDVNVALIDTDDPAVVTSVLSTVDSKGFPTMLMLAGDGTAGELGTAWQHVGSMPFMSYDISSPPEADDARVRRAGPGDLAAVTSLMADAFGLEPAIAVKAAGSVRNPSDAAGFFLVEDDDQPVSTCFASVVDDAVCIWCMSTPEQFARRGYGRALLGHCLAEAHRLGARLGLLGATPAGQPLYEATGWTTLEPWELYLRDTTSAQFSS